jgi:8-oxo-dGTP pyrophosphatase MutT (NUDIX family)
LAAVFTRFVAEKPIPACSLAGLLTPLQQLLGRLTKDVVQVHVSLESSAHSPSTLRLSLAARAQSDDGAVPFAHNDPCPAYVQPVADPGARHLRVGIAVLAEDSKGRCLLTQRSAGMRSFASGWVLPGGGVDAGESLVETGARELHEETGLLVQPGSMRILGLWESTYPFLAAKGQPTTHHHLVVYMLARVSEEDSAAAAAAAPMLQASEVQAATWISPEQAMAILRLGPALPPNEMPVILQPDLQVQDKSQWQHRCPVLVAPNRPLESIYENMTYGTRFALQLWLGLKLGKIPGVSGL